MLVEFTKSDTIIFLKVFEELRAGGLAEESAAVLADLGRLRKGGYTLSVKLRDFTVGRHT